MHTQDKALFRGRIDHHKKLSVLSRLKGEPTPWRFGMALVRQRAARVQFEALGYALIDNTVMSPDDFRQKVRQGIHQRLTAYSLGGAPLAYIPSDREKAMDRCALWWQGRGWKTLTPHYERALTCLTTEPPLAHKDPYVAAMIKLIQRLGKKDPDSLPRTRF